jgi:hypothetical protein
MYADAVRRFAAGEPAAYPATDLLRVGEAQLAATELLLAGEASGTVTHLVERNRRRPRPDSLATAPATPA